MSFEKLQNMKLLSAEADNEKHDYVSPPGELRFDDDCRLITPDSLFGSAPPLAPTVHAYRQIFMKLGPSHFGKGSTKSLPGDYLLALNQDMRAALLNYHLLEANGGEWMVRGYKDRCRAVVDGRYPDVRNTDLLDALIAGIEPDLPNLPDFKCNLSSVTQDHLYFRGVWKDTGRGNGGYGIGAYVGNSEIGDGRVKVLPLLWRTSCENSIVFDVKSIDEGVGLSLTHRGNAAAIGALVKAAIGQVFPVAAEMVNRMIEAETERIPDFSAVIEGLAMRHNWNSEIKTQVLLGTEGQETRAGLVNGVSFAAHTGPLAREGAEAEGASMESLAGALLVAPDSLFGRVANLYHRNLETNKI